MRTLFYLQGPLSFFYFYLSVPFPTLNALCCMCTFHILKLPEPPFAFTLLSLSLYFFAQVCGSDRLMLHAL